MADEFRTHVKAVANIGIKRLMKFKNLSILGQ